MQANKMLWIRRAISAAIVPVCLSLSLASYAQTSAPSAPALTPAEAAKIATDAYIYGYPLVTMEYTRRSATNVTAPDGKSAPMGVLNKFRAYPAVDDHRVTAPNADTLYTTAFIGTFPKNRTSQTAGLAWALLPHADAQRVDRRVPGAGQKNDRNRRSSLPITGPSFAGTVPAGLTQLKSPTGIVWILGRIYCTGTPSDYAAVHAMQDAIVLEPLHALGKPYTPPAGVVNPAWKSTLSVRDQVNALTPDQYFTLLAQLMVDNPPAAADAPSLRKWRRSESYQESRSSQAHWAPTQRRHSPPSRRPRSTRSWPITPTRAN